MLIQVKRFHQKLFLILMKDEILVKNLIKLTDLSVNDLNHIFTITDKIQNNEFAQYLKGKTFIFFFPTSSIRTRITFEMAVKYLGGEAILFPSESLDKKEAIRDVIGYMNNWIDFIIVRHKEIDLLYEMVKYSNTAIADTDLSKIKSKGYLLEVQKLFEELCGILGLLEADGEEPIPAEIEELAQKRKLARESKDYKTADELRDRINHLGYAIEETKNGAKIYKKG